MQWRACSGYTRRGIRSRIEQYDVQRRMSGGYEFYTSKWITDWGVTEKCLEDGHIMRCKLGCNSAVCAYIAGIPDYQSRDELSTQLEELGDAIGIHFVIQDGPWHGVVRFLGFGHVQHRRPED